MSLHFSLIYSTIIISEGTERMHITDNHLWEDFLHTADSCLKKNFSVFFYWELLTTFDDFKTALFI